MCVRACKQARQNNFPHWGRAGALYPPKPPIIVTRTCLMFHIKCSEDHRTCSMANTMCSGPENKIRDDKSCSLEGCHIWSSIVSQLLPYYYYFLWRQLMYLQINVLLTNAKAQRLHTIHFDKTFPPQNNNV